jgi:transcriptional regulator with XRE-family HTH domain
MSDRENKGGRPLNEPGIPAWNGNALKVRRILAGWKIDDLAKRMSVAKSTISRWETGLHAPPAKQLNQLAEIFSIPRASFAREPKVV